MATLAFLFHLVSFFNMLKIWPQRLKDDAKRLAAKVRSSEIRFDVILVVTKWGLHLGYYMAALLGIKDIRTINISSYDWERCVMLRDFTNHDHNFWGKAVLVVDDLIDSWGTLDYIESLLKDRCYMNYAVLYKKDAAKCRISSEKIFFTHSVPQEEWIQFYYEV